MIYVMSGGDNLNFKIVNGTTQPSNPKENTIWVNTGYVMHAYDFSATEPTLRSKNKNLLVYPYFAKTDTANGITWTVSSDGSVEANGAATANGSLAITGGPSATTHRLRLPAGTYHLSGCPSGGSLTTYRLQVAYSYDNWENITYKNDVGSGVVLTLKQEADLSVSCRVASGTTVSNIVFKPQLEKGSAATSFVKGDATGQVWIQTGSVSNGAFNALKKNGIMVYPVKAKLYQNGAWKDKDAQVYQNGAWKDFWNGELFDSGNQYEAVTGGWSSSGLSYTGFSMVAPTISTNMVLSATGNNSNKMSAVATLNKINVTDKSALNINVAGINNSERTMFGLISAKAMAENIVASTLISQTTGTHSLTLDGISGEYYVFIYVSAVYESSGATTTTISKVWLE